jgi:RNA-directed DNA polymerase
MEDSVNAEQQKGEQHHGDGETGGTRSTAHGPQQAFTAFDQQRALTVNLMEQVCDPHNIVRAYRRVRSNKGKPGVDGMTVHELADWLREHHAALTASLLDGTYRPQTVRGVQIPKPGGGQRQLGIPTVSANCTGAQIAFRMGGDPPSVPSASRPAFPSFEGAPSSRH